MPQHFMPEKINALKVPSQNIPDLSENIAPIPKPDKDEVIKKQKKDSVIAWS